MSNEALAIDPTEPATPRRRWRRMGVFMLVGLMLLGGGAVIWDYRARTKQYVETVVRLQGDVRLQDELRPSGLGLTYANQSSNPNANHPRGARVVNEPTLGNQLPYASNQYPSNQYPSQPK